MSDVVLIHCDPVVDQCGYCDNGIQGDQYCRYCNGDGVEVFDLSAVSTLAHNLAVGAAPCLADDNGFTRCVIQRDLGPGGWRPGCNRPAPGWTATTSTEET